MGRLYVPGDITVKSRNVLNKRKIRDLIGNRNRDLPAFSSMPHPTAPQCTPPYVHTHIILRKLFFRYGSRCGTMYRQQVGRRLILQYKVYLNVLNLFKQDFRLNVTYTFSFKITEYTSTLLLYLTSLLVLF